MANDDITSLQMTPLLSTFGSRRCSSVRCSSPWHLARASSLRFFRQFRSSNRPVMSLDQHILTKTDEEKEKNLMDQVHRARYDFMLDYLRFPPLQTRVAGVSFEDRQSILEEVMSGDAVILEREPHNTHDPEAVRVLLLDGRHLGYIPRDLTSNFGELTTVGRVKSVGIGEGGYYGAQIAVQPQLPALLPAFFPHSLSLFAYPFDGYREEQLDKIVQFLKTKENKTCAVTGREGPLCPYLFWRVHLNRKQYELSGIRLIHADLAPVGQMQNAEDENLMQLLAAVNGWTREEAEMYVQGCLERRDADDSGEWIARSVGLRNLLNDLSLPLPPAMKIKSA